MALRKIKISQLPLEGDMAGLVTIGVNSANNSCKVDLSFLKDTVDGIPAAISAANSAANAATNAANSANQSVDDVLEALSDLEEVLDGLTPEQISAWDAALSWVTQAWSTGAGDTKVQHYQSAAAPNGSVDGIFFVKGAGDARFKLYVVANSAVVQIDAISEQDLEDRIDELTKDDVGLSDVDNTSDMAKPISTAVSAALNLLIPLSQKAAANGVATLDAGSKIPVSQLPSIAFSVEEYANFGSFPPAGEQNKIYIDGETGLLFRWTPGGYEPLNAGDVEQFAEFFIRYDQAQSLNPTQKQTARTNIGAAADDTVVKLNADQSIGGVKGFVNVPSSGQDATLGTHLVRLSQVTSLISEADSTSIKEIGILAPPIFSASVTEPEPNERLITLSFVNQSPNLILASPTSSVGTPSFRSLIENDLPALSIAKTTGLQTALDNKQPLNGSLTSISSLSGAAGLLRKIAANTYELDTNTYLTGNQTVTLTGAVTGSGATSITTTLADNIVTNAKLADMNAGTIKGRITTNGDPQDLTAAQVRTLLNVADGANNYVLPVATDTILGGVKQGANVTIAGDGTLSVAAPYTHPTQTAISVTATGVEVMSGITVNTLGHVTAFTKRTLPTANGSTLGVLSAADWTTFNSKQAALVSGTNIKSINGVSLLGSGDLSVGGVSVRNAGGTQQWLTNDSNNQIRFAAAGDTSISFDAATRTITINSVPGTGTGGAVTSFNSRTGGVVSVVGDYNLDMMGDVTLTSLANLQILRYNSATTNWENITLNTGIVPESGNLYFTQARARTSISLTTSGSSGAATYNSSTGALNIPNYTLTDLGGQPLNSILTSISGLSTSTTGLITLTNGVASLDSTAYTPAARTITINGTAGRISSSAGAQNLTANRTWTLDLATSGVSAGTYTKVTVDTYGRATAGASLLEADIPALTISKITGLQGVLDDKEPGFSKGNLVQGTGVVLSGTLTSRLVGAGNITVDFSTTFGDGRYALKAEIPTIPTNYVTTNTDQLTALTGHKTWEGQHVFSGYPIALINGTYNDPDGSAGGTFMPLNGISYFNINSPTNAPVIPGVSTTYQWTTFIVQAETTRQFQIATSHSAGYFAYRALHTIGSNAWHVAASQNRHNAFVPNSTTSLPITAGAFRITKNATGTYVALDSDAAEQVAIIRSWSNSGEQMTLTQGSLRIQTLAGSGVRPIGVSSTGLIQEYTPDTIGNGTLTLATGSEFTGSASFTANQTGNTSFTVGLASGLQIPTTTQVTSWNNMAAGSYVTTNTSQTSPSLSGNKTWSGAHVFSKTDANNIAIERTGSALNTFIQYRNDGGSVFAGIGASQVFSVGGVSNLSGGTDTWLTTSSTLTNVALGGFRVASLAGTGTRLATVSSSGNLGETATIGNAYISDIEYTKVTGAPWITGNQTITLTGNITGSGTTSIATTIANSAVTYAKIQNVTTARLLGRYSAGAGVVQELSLGSGLSLNTSTGVITATAGALTSTYIGVGNGSNELSGSAALRFLESRYINVTSGSGNLAVGVSSTNGFIEAPNGNLLLQTGGSYRTIVEGGIFRVNNLAGSGTRFVQANANGDLIATLSTVTATLTNKQIGFGNGSNQLAGSSNFTYEDNRYINLISGSGVFAAGVASSVNSFVQSVNGHLLLQANSSYYVTVDSGGFKVNALGGGGSRMVTVDNSGNFGAQAIPSGGTPTLTNEQIGFGNGSNLLSGIAGFKLIQSRYVFIEASSNGSSGKMAVGTWGSTAFLEAADGHLVLQSKSGSEIQANNTFRALQHSYFPNGATFRSDIRHKTDILDFSQGLSELKSLRTIEYTMDGRRSYGLPAQDIQKIMPHAITTDKDGTLFVDYNAIHALSINAIKELDKKKADKTEVQKLRKRIKQLETQLKQYATGTNQ